MMTRSLNRLLKFFVKENNENINENLSEVNKAYESRMKEIYGISQDTFEIKRSARFYDGENIYEMNSKPRGFCAIVDNTCFKNNSHNCVSNETERLGTIFSAIGFEIIHQVYDKESEIIKFSENLANLTSYTHDALIFIMISHCMNYPIIDKITSNFDEKNCSALFKKPKIFIFACCRGDPHQLGFKTSIANSFIGYLSPKSNEKIGNLKTVGATVKVICLFMAKYCHYKNFKDIFIKFKIDEEVNAVIISDTLIKKLYFNPKLAGIERKSTKNREKVDLIRILNLKSENLKQYEIIERLALGSFTEVFKAFDKNTKELCAIKRIQLNDNFNGHHDFKKEINILSGLKSKFIVEMKNHWFDNESEKIQSLYIVMEFCEMSLNYVKNQIKSEIPIEFSISENLISYFIMSKLTKQILQGVEFLHSKHVIHRDLKPQNILITNYEMRSIVKIADFGLSCIHENDDQSHTLLIGTLKYMAPELKSGNHYVKYNQKIDIYSLGIMFNDLFEIENLFSNKEGEKKFSRCKFYHLPCALRVLTSKMISRIPHERPDCTEILPRSNEWCMKKSSLSTYSEIGNFINNDADNLSINANNFCRNFILPFIGVLDFHNINKENHKLYSPGKYTVADVTELKNLESQSLNEKSQ